MSKETDIVEHVRRRRLETCKCCDKVTREKNTRENGCCTQVVSSLDGLPVRCVGDWALDKIYYLVQYLGIFAGGMKNKKDTYYVELCSGPGRCSTRNQHEHDGTALAVLNHSKFKHIKGAIFIDNDTSVVEVLNQRIQAMKFDNAKAVVGDYNNIDSILEAFPPVKKDKTLFLCLIDPTDCSLPFDTIKAIFDRTNEKCDFIISYFDGIDLNRNILETVLEPVRFKTNLKKYERFLGDTEFFTDPEIQEFARIGDRLSIRLKFQNAYKHQLAKIGLSYQDEVRVCSQGETGIPYYQLIFASGHSKGLEFWKKATKYSPSGQPSLPGVFL
jgi:three-Cys-motif partner protein